MKFGKASGIDGIQVDLLTSNTNTATATLHGIFKNIRKETIPEDWAKRLIVKLTKKGELIVAIGEG